MKKFASAHRTATAVSPEFASYAASYLSRASSADAVLSLRCQAWSACFFNAAASACAWVLGGRYVNAVFRPEQLGEEIRRNDSSSAMMIGNIRLRNRFMAKSVSR